MNALAGKSLADLARARKLPPTPETPPGSPSNSNCRGGCSAIYHAIHEDDVERILRFPFTMVASDGGIPSFGVAAPHPRLRYLRPCPRPLCPRTQGLTLEDAVRRMTSLPAQRLNLQDRGLIRPACAPTSSSSTRHHHRTMPPSLDPHQYATGVHSVWVNGVLTLDGGKMTASAAARSSAAPPSRAPPMITPEQERAFYDRQYDAFLALPDHALRLDRAVLEPTSRDPAHPFYERRRLYRAAIHALEEDPLPGRRVLDYGCGPADFGIWMATEQAEVTLLDLSPKAIELGLRRAAASGVARRVKGVAADATRLDMFADQAFELVFACASLHHTLKYPGAVEELARIMKPGARLVLCETWGANPLLNAARRIRAKAAREPEEQGEDIILNPGELRRLDAHFDSDSKPAPVEPPRDGQAPVSRPPSPRERARRRPRTRTRRHRATGALPAAETVVRRSRHHRAPSVTSRCAHHADGCEPSSITR
jgi:SAM-dependent methyltransferase